MSFDKTLLMNAVLGNLSQAAGGVVQSEIEEAVYSLVGDGINSFPKAALFLAKFPKISRRVGVVALLNVLKANPNILGAENAPYVRVVNEAIESFAEGVGRAAADITEEDGRQMATRVISAGSVDTLVHESVAHRGDGNCHKRMQLISEWSRLHPATSKRVGSGKDAKTVTVPGDPFEEIRLSLADAIEQGVAPCPACMKKFIQGMEWARPVEPPKSKDWWEAYSDYEQTLIAQLPGLFGEEAADLLEYMGAAPVVFMKPVLAKSDNGGTLKPEVVLAIRDALYAWTSLDKTAKDRIGAMVKAWAGKNTRSGQAAAAKAVSAARKTAKIVALVGGFDTALLATAIFLLLVVWKTGRGGPMAALATTSGVGIFTAILLILVMPFDALADIVRKFVARLTGVMMAEVDLDGVKYGLRMAMGSFIAYGCSLAAVLYLFEGPNGTGSGFARAALFGAFLLNQGLAAVIAANPSMLRGMKESLVKGLAYSLSGGALLLMVLALTGWLVNWGTDAAGHPVDGREAMRAKAAAAYEWVFASSGAGPLQTAVSVVEPAQHMWGHTHGFWCWVVFGGLAAAILGGVVLAVLGAMDESESGVARGLRSAGSFLAVLAVIVGLLAAMVFGLPLAIDRVFGIGEPDDPTAHVEQVAPQPEPALAAHGMDSHQSSAATPQSSDSAKPKGQAKKSRDCSKVRDPVNRETCLRAAAAATR